MVIFFISSLFFTEEVLKPFFIVLTLVFASFLLYDFFTKKMVLKITLPMIIIDLIFIGTISYVLYDMYDWFLVLFFVSLMIVETLFQDKARLDNYIEIAT